MPNGYTMAHCLWLAHWAYSNSVYRPDQYHVLLYDDEEDQLGPWDDIEDIETEPTDGSYQRAALAFPADTQVAMDSENQYVDIRATTATFNFEGVTGEVDSAGIAWEAQLPYDDEERLHLMVRSELDERHDLAEMRGTYPVDAGWQIHTLF